MLPEYVCSCCPEHVPAGQVPGRSVERILADCADRVQVSLDWLEPTVGTDDDCSRATILLIPGLTGCLLRLVFTPLFIGLLHDYLITGCSKDGFIRRAALQVTNTTTQNRTQQPAFDGLALYRRKLICVHASC